MSDDKKTVIFAADLDAAAFVTGANEAKNALSNLTNTEGVSELIEKLSHVTIGLGLVGAALFAVKTAMDLTFEAEKIKQVNYEFERLSANAGISGEALKASLEESAGGLVSQNDLLNAANRALVTLGDSASKLPEIMTIARNVTATMGGDLMTNFNNLAMAIENGNQRMLKRMGITLDVKKATEEYAKAHNVLASELNAVGIKEAYLAEALSVTKDKLQEQNPGITEGMDSWQRFKVAITETGEALTLFFDKIFGPRIRSMIDGFATLSKGLKEFTFGKLGDDAQKTEYRIKELTSAIETQKGNIKKYKDALATPVNWTASGLDYYNKVLKNTQDQMAKNEEELTKLTVKNKEADKEILKSSEDTTKKSITNDKAVSDNKEKLIKQLLELQIKYDKEVQKTNTDIKNIDANIQKQIKDIHAKTESEIAKVMAERPGHEKQADAVIAQLRKNDAQDVKKVENEKRKMYKETIDNLRSMNATASQEFQNGFQAAAESAGMSLRDFAQQGANASADVTDVMVAGFKAMGDGSQSMESAMKKAFLGAIGARAIATGSLMIAEGLWPPNPIELGAGGVLVALGAKLESMAGSSSGVSAGGGGGGGAGASKAAAVSLPRSVSAPTRAAAAPREISAPAESQYTPSAPALQQSQAVTAQRHVTVKFQGDFLSTDQTRQKFMDMIRSETDATDFKYVQVGKS